MGRSPGGGPQESGDAFGFWDGKYEVEGHVSSTPVGAAGEETHLEVGLGPPTLVSEAEPRSSSQ